MGGAFDLPMQVNNVIFFHHVHDNNYSTMCRNHIVAENYALEEYGLAEKHDIYSVGG